MPLAVMANGEGERFVVHDGGRGGTGAMIAVGVVEIAAEQDGIGRGWWHSLSEV